VYKRSEYELKFENKLSSRQHRCETINKEKTNITNGLNLSSFLLHLAQYFMRDLIKHVFSERPLEKKEAFS